MTRPSESPAPAPATPPTALAKSGETAAVAAAEQARAAVESRYLVAMRHPRDFLAVRSRILNACKRPGFAAKARYAKPIGGNKFLYGPSIRFAEEALRCMGNVYIDRMVVYDDRQKRIVRISVTDLEANVSYPHDITIEKTVERRSASDRTVLSSRQNSEGKTVYLVEATEDELLNKEGALSSKAIRGGALRLLPADILEEAMEQVIETLKAEDAKDPQEMVKKVADAFFGLGVDAKQLAEFVGHPLSSCSPAEIQRLRMVFQAIDQGETTWAEIFEIEKLNRDGLEQIRAERAESTGAAQQAGARGLASRLKSRADAKAAPKPDLTAYAARMTTLANREIIGDPLTPDEQEELRQWRMDSASVPT